MWLHPFDLDKFSVSVETYVQTVCVLLGEKVGDEAACVRVIEHMGTVVRSMLKNAPPEETAVALIPQPK
jgi:hypothetical protein